MAFIFGGDTGMSYEDVQRKRKIAESLLAANTRGSRNVGEGLGAIGRALAAKAIEKRTGAAMERLNKEAEDLYSGVFGGGISSGGGASAPRVSTSSLDRSNDPTFIADDAMRAIGREPIHTEWEQIREGIFAGESGGDYDALFGYSQRPGGQFEGVKPTDMTVAEVSQFTDPSGDYGQWVKGQVGRVATPVGAYQIVGTTLRGAIDAGVVSPDEKFTREVQDRVGKWVLSTQGTGAWEGYKGPQAAGVAQPGGGGQPNVQAIVAALGNPIIRQDPGKVAVLNALLGQALEPEDPMQALELERAQLEIDALRNPPAPKPPSSVQEYQFYEQQERAAGRVPKSYAEWSIMDEQAANPAINSVPPDEEELRKKLGAKEGELWADYQRQGGVAAGTQADLDLLDELIQYAPQGPLTGRLAEALPGFNSAADAFQSIVKRVAPTMRAEGSGSTSDIEYGGMLRSLPQLMVRPEGNRAIVAMMRAKSQIDRERANVVNKYQNGEISAVEARKAIQEIDSRSIMTPELQAIIGATAPQGDQGEVGDIPTYNPETGQWE